MGKKQSKKSQKPVSKANRAERKTQGIRPQRLTLAESDLIIEYARCFPLSKLWRGGR